MVPFHLPTGTVVLAKAVGVAADNFGRGLVFKQSADDTEFRNNSSQFLRDPAIPLHVHQFRAEAGAVVAVHLENLLLLGFGQHHGGIHRQISAFGVSSHPVFPIGMVHNSIQIFRRQLLGGHQLKAHAEIFPPAH